MLKTVMDAVFEHRSKHPEYTYEYIAGKMHTSASTVCRWCTGKSTPSFDEVAMLAEVIGLSLPSVFATLGRQEFRDSEQIGFKGAKEMLAEFEADKQATREAYERQITHHVEMRTIAKQNYDDTIRRLEENYTSNRDYLQTELRELRQANDKLQERAVAAESDRKESETRRHQTFWGMLIVIIILVLAVVGLASYIIWEFSNPFAGITEILLRFYGITPTPSP